ncbi:sulfatase [Kineosporiaceae bacterium SCSIO 59966]|nr:sulfatase [Kineosporiaceae bacterium SCSIO 59966]
MTNPLPNVALIHCHDLGDWLSCYGWDGVPSPHLQEFADNAIVFDKAFATAPLCTPARASLFTGRLPHSNGLMGLAHQGWRYRSGVVTLPELLSKAGYRTTLLGLQHEDLDARVLGYDEVHGLGFLPRALEVARLTQRWMDGSKPGADQPYFAVIGLWEVHRPWPAEDYEPVDPASVTVPPYLPDNEHSRRDISAFYGAIRQMDEAVGRIVRTLRSGPDGDNTLIIFTTDHGVPFPRAKSTLYDAGVKVALIVSPPPAWGVPPGRHAGLVSHLDITPTLIELAGVEAPDDLEGVSILDQIRGGSEGERSRELFLEKTYHDRYDPIRAVRTESTKYIRNFVAGPRLPLAQDLEESETRKGMGDAHLAPRPEEELYLLESDPWELDNRAEDPQCATLRQEMAARLLEHLQRSDDPVLSGAVPPPEPPLNPRAAPNA